MILKYDCRHFPGDRPCKPHKETGVICDTCPHYETVSFKILIIKLDAMGDVLRTTSLLHALKKEHPVSFITWLTKFNAKDIFKNNDLVDEVLVYEEPSTAIRLAEEEFGLVINLDPSPQSSALASTAKAEKKTGFGLNKNGKVFPFNHEAEEWFEMGAFDKFKSANKKSYQQIIHEICGLKYDKGRIILNLTNRETEKGKEFASQNGLSKYDYLIGINAGASDRWEYKKWRPEGYIELMKKLSSEFKCAFLLFGGKNEVELNRNLSSAVPGVYSTGNNNTFRDFASYVSLVDVLVTGDTLALHVSAGLGIFTVCLFGPTSSAEIEDYGLIKKITPDMNCLVCYKNTCDLKPNCMELITTDMVFAAVKNILLNKLVLGYPPGHLFQDKSDN
ncbi:MAG: glycosyltransferase family 9 protein [Ignavibacteriae bacterium]|nr:glycosyltransferase family 9 protein [Ignavibacteriota bacterium]